MGKKRKYSNKISRSVPRKRYRGRPSSKGGSKRFLFHDFYEEEIEIQDHDFPVLCSRYKYPKHFSDELSQMAYDLRCEFEREVIDPGFLEKIDSNRVDLTEETVFTIDGDDAQDFDDAVSLRKEGGRYHLGVHIADVSYFIKENSPLDKEALRRGTSVYLTDKVIPMFPESISNHLCSLVEGEYRFTYSCFAEIDEEGAIQDYQFKRSVIKSARRCTYREVEEFFRGKKTLSPKIDKVLLLMNELKIILRNRRIAHGAIDFATEEQYFTLDRERVLSVELKRPLDSENLIEEFMLVANICAAEILNKLGTGIYRVHDLPRTEKLYAFERMLAQHGYRMPRTGTLNPLREKGVNRYMIFLNGIKDLYIRSNLSFLLLISMSQAEYSTENIGHYGLGFKNYTHFTSPIRRYPDLSVHRLISRFYDQSDRSASGKGRGKNPLKELKMGLKKVAQLSSENERKAVGAEREYNKVKSMRFLQEHPDRVMEVMVIKVGENGMFVKELETGIEGFVSSYDLEPDLFFDPTREVYTRKKKVIYELGTRLTVKLSHLNFKKMFIDLKPALVIHNDGDLTLNEIKK